MTSDDAKFICFLIANGYFILNILFWIYGGKPNWFVCWFVVSSCGIISVLL